jgi:hypothetical protein
MTRTILSRPARPPRPPRSPRSPRYVVFDIDRPEIVHTRLDCIDHVGLIDVVDQWYGGPCDDPEVVEEVAFRHGLLVPAELVERGKPCPHCTLVAAPLWLAAA